MQAEGALRESERRLHEIIEAIPAAVYTTDAEGRITFFNRAAVKFSGRVPELGTDSWCVTWKLYNMDGTPLPHHQCPMAVALREKRPILGGEAVAERPDGQRRAFTPYPRTCLKRRPPDGRGQHAGRYDPPQARRRNSP